MMTFLAPEHIFDATENWVGVGWGGVGMMTFLARYGELGWDTSPRSHLDVDEEIHSTLHQESWKQCAQPQALGLCLSVCV